MYHHNRPSTVISRINSLRILNFSKIKQTSDSPTYFLSLKSQITEAPENFPTKEYLKIFQKYLERMQLCINNRGDYFEHLKIIKMVCNSLLIIVSLPF